MARPNTGASLALNERGIYEIRWSENRRTHRLSTRTNDLPSAQRFLAGWLMEREREQAAKAVMTVAGVMHLYKKECIDEGRIVDKVRQDLCIRNLMTYFADIACRDIDLDHVREYCDLRADGTIGMKAAKSTETLRRELSVLKAAMHHAVKRKRMTLADMSHIDMPAKKQARQLWLTETERDQLLSYADKRKDKVKLFIYLALCTAARRRSIERLTWDVVDMQARIIHYDRLPGERTRKRRVPVPINDRLYPVLAEAKLASSSPYVMGDAGRVTHRFTTLLERLAKQTKNDKFLQVTPHTLRHTWATLAARAGTSMYQIAGVLGDTVATVERNYLKHSPDHLRDAVNF